MNWRNAMNRLLGVLLLTVGFSPGPPMGAEVECAEGAPRGQHAVADQGSFPTPFVGKEAVQPDDRRRGPASGYVMLYPGTL